MKSDEVRASMRRQPFQPFDIRMSNGRAYEVDHPEFLAISRNGTPLYYATSEDERLVHLDLDHVVSLELKNAPTPRRRTAE